MWWKPVRSPIGGHISCLTQESTLRPTVQLILIGSVLSFFVCFVLFSEAPKMYLLHFLSIKSTVQKLCWVLMAITDQCCEEEGSCRRMEGMVCVLLLDQENFVITLQGLHKNNPPPNSHIQICTPLYLSGCTLPTERSCPDYLNWKQTIYDWLPSDIMANIWI